MTLEQFREWLNERIAEASNQELFRLRCWIRDTRSASKRQLRDRQKRLEAARAVFEQSKQFIELQQASREVESLQKGVIGLSAAVEEGRAKREKLHEFQRRMKVAEQRLVEAERNQDNQAKRRLDRAVKSWNRLQEELGLAEAETKLDQLGDQLGTASSSAGVRFEAISSQAAQKYIIPDLQLADHNPFVLHGVTLGCPRGELDQIVVTIGEKNIAKVHAVVEAKSNINDLAHGFRVRQENLAWFAGDPQGFDVQMYKNDKFTSGMFGNEIVTHQEHGRTFAFDSTSFDMFRNMDHPPYRLNGLYFVTENRPLLGLESGDLNRLMYRVATDFQLDIGSKLKLSRLYHWLLDFVKPVQSVDVLRLYAQEDQLAKHILFAPPR
ncbi:MAG: hypothetical protein KDB22_25670 [Planctomycetales bacterium]|nr:hypothetical protein [Planctomycetales bacterium]